MLEYFTYKKVKKHREEKAEKERTENEQKEAASDAKPKGPGRSHTSSPSQDRLRQKGAAPVLDREDERFFEWLTSITPGSPSDDEEERPPLPPRIRTPEVHIDSDASSIESRRAKNKNTKTALAEKPDEKPKRFSFINNLGNNLTRNMSIIKKKEDAPPQTSGLKARPSAKVSDKEAVQEEVDVARVLNELDLSAEDNKAFSFSKEGTDMLRRFTQVLKDLVNGVPTAYNDLIGLIEDRDGVLQRSYDKLPNSLKKLVTQLPEQLTSKLAPELLAVAAEAQGLNAEETIAGGMKGAAKSFLTPSNLHDLVTKPGAIASMLKAIVNALKTRWPAFMGTSVLWSIAIFLLLTVLWYCYKRGREVRLEGEAAAAQGDPIDGRDRVEELPDDLQLPRSATTRRISSGPGGSSSRPTSHRSRHSDGSDRSSRRSHGSRRSSYHGGGGGGHDGGHDSISRAATTRHARHTTSSSGERRNAAPHDSSSSSASNVHRRKSTRHEESSSSSSNVNRRKSTRHEGSSSDSRKKRSSRYESSRK